MATAAVAAAVVVVAEEEKSHASVGNSDNFSKEAIEIEELKAAEFQAMTFLMIMHYCSH